MGTEKNTKAWKSNEQQYNQKDYQKTGDNLRWWDNCFVRERNFIKLKRSIRTQHETSIKKLTTRKQQMPRKSEKVKEHNCYVIGFNRKAADVFMWQHKGCNMLICLEMRE